MSDVTQLHMSVTPSNGPGGRTWIAATIGYGPTSYTFGIPVEQAETFLREFTAIYRQAIAQTRPQIVMPDIGPLTGHTCEDTGQDACLGCAVVRAASVAE